MRTAVAHGLRRTARRLIKWSNKLEPHFEHVHTAFGTSGRQAGADFARQIQYSGQAAGAAIPGLMETLDTSWQSRIAAGLAGAHPALPNQGAPVRRSRITRLMDWLERTDWGYGLGLLTMLAAAVIALFGSPWWWISAPLVFVAFALCWWFG